MRRRVVTILALLVAGAVVNVGVAWGSAVWSGPSRRVVGAEQAIDGSHGWSVTRSKTATCDWVRLEWYVQGDSPWQLTPGNTHIKGPHPATLIPWWLTVVRPKLVPDDDRSLSIVEADGWPIVSLWSSHFPSKGVLRAPLLGSLNRRSVLDEPAFLPLRPIPFGFAVNTAFYTAVLWLLIPGPFALRRLVRRRRGLCPSCAYPMGEAAVCTECGKPLPGRAEAVT